MRFVFGIILLITVALATYFYYPKSEILPVSTVTPAQQVKEVILEMPKLEAPKENAIKTSIQAPIEIKKLVPQYAVKPKSMTVQFEVIDGLAVAYGDTILGKPSSDFSEKIGVTEIRPPKYWDHGIIPYLIKEDVVNPERITRTIEYFNQNTSVRFVPYDHQSDAIVFVRGEQNCQSFLGKTGGIQPIYLSEKCNQPEITHELMHALGFIHEQSRYDRDQFINILWANIDEKFQSQFAMVPEPLMEPYFDSAFDQTSIMMYEAHMFAIRPELETMKLKNGMSLGITSRKLSHSDIERVSRLYPR